MKLYEKFWNDDEFAHKDNCFCKDSTQVALGIRMGDECVFTELDEKGSPWGITPLERRIELNKRYNDKAETIVGKRLLQEDYGPLDAQFPAARGIGEIFGGEYVYDGNTTWLKGNCNTPSELENLLNKVNDMNIRDYILPENWEIEKTRIFEKYGIRPQVWRHFRGPTTFAISLYGVENLIYLIMDEEDLAKYFSNTILKVLREYVNVFDIEAGAIGDNKISGFHFYDDDCALVTPDMYELFSYPVLENIFNTWSPLKGDVRFQHSDSDMGHLLPILSKLNLTGCNFGPKISVSDIRRNMPETRIDGQIAPFTFMSNDPEAIMLEVKRDCEQIKNMGLRGLNLTTAGSINSGSLLSSMKVVMDGILEFGQF